MLLASPPVANRLRVAIPSTRRMTQEAGSTPSPKSELLSARGITKSFPGVKALTGVNFTVRRGEVHALMGENGAGKSTLIKVLTGVYPRDGGTVKLDGAEINPHSPKSAEALGI